MQIQDQTPAAPNAPTQDSSSPQVPALKNYSQAHRLAQLFFGPLTRIRSVGSDYSLSVEKGGEVLAVLSSGQPSLQKMLQVALDMCLDFEAKRGHLPRGCASMMAVDTVKAQRLHLLAVLPSLLKGETQELVGPGVAKLHPNEVLAVAKLVLQAQTPSSNADNPFAFSAIQNIGADLADAARRNKRGP